MKNQYVIKKQSRLSQKIKHLDLIIWDEACMFNKNTLECLDRTLKDLRNTDKLFGGITLVLSGDWRRILPVLKMGNGAKIVDSSLK